MRGNKELQHKLVARGSGIEMCPISNLQTKAVQSTAEYPLREFLDAGLKVTINTDNRTVSNTTLTKELEFVHNHKEVQETADRVAKSFKELITEIVTNM